MRKRVLFIALAASAYFPSQTFSDFRARYDHLPNDDPAAFRYVNPYIAKAKREHNEAELVQAYKDAVSFSPNQKMAYADSMIAAAHHSRDRALIGMAYLTKGTVYYFNYRKFKPALDEYLKAWTYTQHSADPYLYYKTLYHIGVVKSYLGYYEDALTIFRKCHRFFERPVEVPEPPNIKFNRKKALLNVMHQEAVCLLHMGQLPEAERKSGEGWSASGSAADFALERSYFAKLQGIIAYQMHDDRKAVELLNNALPVFEHHHDFTNASLAYFYTGKSAARVGDETEAIRQFIKIDSVFRQRAFVLPEVRPAFEYLIRHHHRHRNREQELYYTTQLLKADRIIAADYQYLSDRIHREYDTADLLAARRRLENRVPYLYSSIAVLLFALAAVGIVLGRRYRTERRRRKKYELLLRQAEAAAEPGGEVDAAKKERALSDRAVIDLMQKLEIFEKERLFLEKGLTRRTLAHNLKTNESYLSKAINKHKGSTFNTYINGLRIAYITQVLKDSTKTRNYSMRSLAEECGFADRNKFVEAFTEVHGMPPAEFIARLRS